MKYDWVMGGVRQWTLNYIFRWLIFRMSHTAARDELSKTTLTLPRMHLLVPPINRCLRHDRGRAHLLQSWTSKQSQSSNRLSKLVDTSVFEPLSSQIHPSVQQQQRCYQQQRGKAFPSLDCWFLDATNSKTTVRFCLALHLSFISARQDLRLFKGGNRRKYIDNCFRIFLA